MKLLHLISSETPVWLQDETLETQLQKDRTFTFHLQIRNESGKLNLQCHPEQVRFFFL